MRLRLLVDQTGEDVFLNSDRTPSELLRDAIRVMRKTKRQQTLYNLCLHITDDTLTLHWTSNDEKFSNAIELAAETVTRGMVAILKGGGA